MLLETCTPADLRKRRAEARAIDSGRWQTIREMGLLGLLAPESAGGMGMGLTDLVGIAGLCGSARGSIGGLNGGGLCCWLFGRTPARHHGKGCGLTGLNGGSFKGRRGLLILGGDFRMRLA